MKRTFFRTGLLTLTALLACFLLSVTSAAAASLPELTCEVGAERGGTATIVPQSVNNSSYLFLPAAADLSQLSFYYTGSSASISGGLGTAQLKNGEPFNLSALFANESRENGYPVTVTIDGRSFPLTILRSENLPSLYLTSADAKKDRAWVAASKDNKAKNGGIVMLRDNGTPIYSGVMKNIKSRGNSTWYYPKTPYQFKLNEEVDLLETGIAAEAEETWILLANYCDETLLHNSVVFSLAEGLGLPYTPRFQQVDLYYDSEYQGTYLLCEKTEVGDGRVDIANMDDAVADANPQVKDFEVLETAQAKNNGGHLYQYVKGLVSPADLSGGYLLELDYQERALEEKCWFTTALGYYVVCKSPEFTSKESVAYISQHYQRFEDAICNNGVDASTGRDYSEYVDVDSLAKCYLIFELSQNTDAFRSSTFFYKNAGEGIFHAGPVWDYDSAFGSTDAVFSAEELTTANVTLAQYLLSLPSFRSTLYALYQNQMESLLNEMLYGSAGTRVPTLDQMAAECAASQRMNAILWPESSPASYPQAVKDLRSFLKQRANMLDRTITEWNNLTSSDIRFFDVLDSSWYHDAVYYVASHKLFNGTSQSIFSPNESMTRGMAVTVLYRMAGSPGHSQASSPFSDVKDNAWYTDGVLWAAENGITNGCGDGTFQPDLKVTRQEFAVFLYRMSGCPNSAVPPHPFGDWNKVEGFAVPAMNWAITNNLMKGDEMGLLTPASSVTRAMAATLLQRYCEGNL